MARTSLDDAALAIVNAEHHDPFSYLGMHGGGKQGLWVRAFVPGAEVVDVVDTGTGKVAARMTPADPAGLFTVHMAKHSKRFSYRLRVTIDGQSRDIDDPYGFAPVLSEFDRHLLSEGNHFRSFEKLGAHVMTVEGVEGVLFAVWAPNARRVSVVGDFNDWDGRRHSMRVHPGCGIWEIFIPGIGEGTLYKFEIKAQNGDLVPLKADPYATFMEQAPGTASIVYDLHGHEWSDDAWMKRRAETARCQDPISIYEVHLGSWRRNPEQGGRSLSYLEMADELVPYVKEMGFTHIELLPVSEFPFEGSWGYQPIGLFAPTSRFGPPNDFRVFVERCHAAGIGVILDWVVGHFPEDAHGLGLFDGTHLYEHADPRLGRHADWGTLIYNFGRDEVSNYLLANALFWFDAYHIDGLRVDAVASMLYLDYSRKDGEWIPNMYGGNENLEAIAFLKRLNELVYSHHPGAFTVAEESTAWPMVSRPTYLGGLGFGFKWNMGWMNDTLRFMGRDPIYRQHHLDDLTFGLLYAFQENFVLPLSHDEVVHGKGSLIGRMPGDRWQRFANLRLYLSFMYTHPGKKLLFMGGEFAQEAEWDHDGSLDWHLLDDDAHRGVQKLVRDLNHLYRDLPSLHERDTDHEGFAWIECHDRERTILAFRRRGAGKTGDTYVIGNFTPMMWRDFRLGVSAPGDYVECFNSDSAYYGGSNAGNTGVVTAEAIPMHGQPFSLSLTLPPLAVIMLRPAES
ncbi:MAG: 1,4-alpha-glucan branching protein GlgB [Rhodospirillales bacterium]|nr:1,4-alpha-glucan branching protein GlgB [Rhodospirillales bacterium]